MADNDPVGTTPPESGWSIDAPATNGVGVWPRLTDYSAERCLVMEATLWLPFCYGTDASHTVQPETNWDNPVWANSPGVNGTSVAGMNLIDRYRHGKYPPLLPDGLTFNPAKGIVKYNMLFGDGHVSALTSIADGVHAIQMRDP